MYIEYIHVHNCLVTLSQVVMSVLYTLADNTLAPSSRPTTIPLLPLTICSTK